MVMVILPGWPYCLFRLIREMESGVSIEKRIDLIYTLSCSLVVLISESTPGPPRRIIR